MKLIKTIALLGFCLIFGANASNISPIVTEARDAVCAASVAAESNMANVSWPSQNYTYLSEISGVQSALQFIIPGLTEEQIANPDYATLIQAIEAAKNTAKSIKDTLNRIIDYQDANVETILNNLAAKSIDTKTAIENAKAAIPALAQD